MTNDLFDVDPERAAMNACMNRLIVAGAGKGVTLSTFARTGGQPSPSDPALRERLSDALNDLESAQKRGDTEDIAYCEHRVTQCVEDARAGREGRQEQPRDENGKFVRQPSFDGGVRGTRRAGGVNARGPESANELFRRMVMQSKYEAQERGEEQVVRMNT